MIHGIAIVGGNGSGKSTLSRRLAELLNYTPLDVEDFYFPIPSTYTNARTKAEVQQLLLEAIEQHPQFVFASVGGDMGPAVNARYDLVVCIDVPLEERLRRVQARSLQKFGHRALPGGDLYQQEQAFLQLVAGRSLDKLTAFLQAIPCPVVHVNGLEPIETNAQHLAELIIRRSP